MSDADGAELPLGLPDGYVSGPEAAIVATRRALVGAEDARAVVLVEGLSDQIAVETLAKRRTRDLASEGVVVLPIGGAQAIVRYLFRFGPAGRGLDLAGLCDTAETDVFRRGLVRAGVGSPGSVTEMAELAFHICVQDLEDELIRAAGPENVEGLFTVHGDLGAFRRMQRQPEWRHRDPGDQMRRFLASGARRKLRYARILVEAISLDRIPRPLDSVLLAVIP